MANPHVLYEFKWYKMTCLLSGSVVGVGLVCKELASGQGSMHFELLDPQPVFPVTAQALSVGTCPCPA